VTAPGFDYADPKLKNSVTLGQYIPADADNPPQGVVTPITPALVRAQSQSRPTGVPAGVQSLFGEAKQYTIGPSDVLAIIVYDHPELAPLPGAGLTQSADPTGVAVAPGFRVSDTGEVSFPYAGRIKLAGLTEIEASDLLAKRLARVIKDPQVTVRIQSFRSRRAYVEGEVKTPGTQVFTDIPMTLPEAINRAGGLTPLGDRSFVTLTRGDQTTAINLVQLQESGVNPNRILLQSGDLLSVKSREDSKVFVMGEIIKPSVLNMRNGRMSLNEAMSEAGGPNLNTANLGQIYVVRNNEQGNPLVFHLNARSPIALALADSFALRPRDVVYLDNVPLVSWNRIVNLIIPSGSALLTGRNIVR
jgi:polysaccharide export outer membrane protein